MQVKHKTCFLKKMNAVYSHTPTSIDSNSYDFYHHRLSTSLFIYRTVFLSYHRKTCFIVKFELTYIIYYYIL